MRRAYGTLVGGVVLFSAFGMSVAVLFAAANIPGEVAGGSVPTLPPTPLPAVMPTPHSASVVDGVRGITPRTRTADPQTPTYTERDVRDYFASRGIVGTAGGPTLVGISFETVDEARKAMDGGVSRFPDTMLVCVVHLSGSFTQQSGNGPGA